MKFPIQRRSGLVLATLLSGVVPGTLIQAQADVYHSVAAGDTLASIARHYNITPATLRTFNNLTGVQDNAALGAMLLRIPDATQGTGTTAGTTVGAAARYAAPAAPRTASATPGMGVIAKLESYVVGANDTTASIAASYSAKGYPVTADGIRASNRNRFSGEPAPGSTIVVPLQKSYYQSNEEASITLASSNGGGTLEGGATFSAPLAADAVGNGHGVGARTVSTPLAGGASMSDEIQITERRDPIYQAPNQWRQGPSVLDSRHNNGHSSSDGLRVLGQGEDAANTSPAPQTRVLKPSDATQQLARVAEVSINGGRIRRLPDASAVTLYSCPVGTQMAVIKQNGPWSAILMSDRSTGWIPTRYLRMTTASVDVSNMVPNDSLRGRPSGGSTSYSNGSYSSSNGAVQFALGWLGTPYSYGGTSRRGIDCSSLVQKSFSAQGYRLPRTAAEQARVGNAVDPANLQAGDRLYFSASGSRIDHTGLYMGDGLFVHASGSGRCVMVSSLYESRNWNIFVGARR